MQGVDPLDPLLQNLVQDKLFITAVQTSQLHAAAAAAVKLCKSYFASHTTQDHKKQGIPARNGLPTTRYPSHAVAGAPYHSGIGPAVRSMKQEVLLLEDSIPWTHVHRTWRNKRTTWRRRVKQTELVTDFAVRLKDLRSALLTEDVSSFIGCGPTWRAQLESCAQGRGTAVLLISVWDEMKNTIRSWIQGSSVVPAGIAGPAVVSPSAGTNNAMAVAHANGNGTAAAAAATAINHVGHAHGNVTATSGRAVQALQAAIKDGSADVLLQTPLESIVGNDTQNLHAVRQVIELERRIVIARIAAMQNGNLNHSIDGAATGSGRILLGNSQGALSSYFTSIDAEWEHSDFDSGGDTEMDQGSEMTDLDAAFD